MSTLRYASMLAPPDVASQRRLTSTLCVKENNLLKATLKFIGHINTPYKAIEDCPNNVDLNGPLCQLVIHEEYMDGMLGLQPGQKILILYWFENTDRSATKQESNNGEELIGTFALRSPHRPNPIGAAVLPIETIDNTVVSVKGLDCLDGTHLLDIKPAIKHEVSNKNTKLGR
jgi:tRNA-Thr(GGU) m(6)t(6)A37 methyltransferase TsaA